MLSAGYAVRFGRQAAKLCITMVAFSSHPVSAAPGDLLTVIDNPAPQSGSQFGFSLGTLNGDILVGAPYQDWLNARDCGIAYRFNTEGQIFYSIDNPMPTRNDQFGYSICAFNGDVLVGAPLDEVPGAAAGGAVHYVQGETGRVLRSISSPAPRNYARFGSHLFVYKGKFVSSAPRDLAESASNAGAAYLLNKKAKSDLRPTRNPRRKCFSPRHASRDLFGKAVAALHNSVLVGAPGDDFRTSNTGAAFYYCGRTARLQQVLENPHPFPEDAFGSAVALISRTGKGVSASARAVVGAPGASTWQQVRSGRVFVFDAATGDLELIIEDPAPGDGNQFGAAVHNAMGNILVGAPGYNGNSGIAYLFCGSTGELIATLQNPDPTPGDEFGSSLGSLCEAEAKESSSPLPLIVGAPKNTINHWVAAGSIYLFEGVN